ncbi:MAG: hypothetical protein V2A65_07725 [Candidatus Omnitrophota bacterium]
MVGERNKVSFLRTGLTTGILVLSLLVNYARADCRISKGKEDRWEAIVLENDYIRVKVLPESNGRIAEYILKGAGGERKFFPKMVFKTFEIMPDVETILETNFSGLEDWIWEVGLTKQYLKYQSKILEKSKEKSSVELSLAGSEYRIIKTVSIFKDSSEVAIQVKLVNRTSEKKIGSYWPHTCIALDGVIDNDNTRIYVPMNPSTNLERRKGLYLQKIEQETVYSRKVSDRGKDNGSDFFAPAQEWWAMVKDNLVLGMLVPLSETDRDGMYYSWSGPAGLSMELIYNSYEFLPGQEQIYHLSFVSTEGLDSIDYINKYITLAVGREKVKVIGDVVTVPIKISGVRKISNYRLELIAIDKNGNEITKGVIEISELTPIKVIEKEVALKGIKDKGYGLKFRLYDSKGTKIDENKLLGIF